MERKSEWLICFILSVLLVVAGIGGIVVSLINERVSYAATGSAALIAGILGLTLVFLLRSRIKDESQKAENLDKLYEKDGWESCGCGLYILASAKADLEEEIKRKAESKAYMEKNFPDDKEKK